MTETPTDRNDQRTRREAASDDVGTEPPALEATVVRYEERADRCTVTPRACTGYEQLTTWLTADATAFVDLEAKR